jgi:Copine
MEDLQSDNITASFTLSEDETNEGIVHLKCLLRKFRIRLNATNLPSNGVLRGSTAPDTFAVITSVAEPTENDSIDPFKNGVPYPSRPAPLDERMTSTESSASRRSSVSSRRGSSASDVWGTTEVVSMSRNPQWTKTIAIDYITGSNQIFFVHLFLRTVGRNVPFGSAQFNIADLTSLKHMVQMKRLRCGGNLYCRLEPVHDPSKLTNTVQLKFGAVDLVPHGKQNMVFHKGLPDTVLEISKPEWSGWIVVHRSPPVKGSLNPVYDTAYVSLGDLCGQRDKSDSGKNCYDEPFHISVFSFKGDQRSLIGIAETTLRHLLINAGRGSINENVDDEGSSEIEKEAPKKEVSKPIEFKLQRSLQKLKEAGRIVVLKASLLSEDGSQFFPEQKIPGEIEITSLDALQPLAVPHKAISERFSKYIANGCQIDFCVAIDFTSSNGNPARIDSNHHHDGHSLNDYEETITVIGAALSKYNECNDYTVWGFGAKFGGVVRHIFQCGPTATVKGVDGILSAYQSVFESDLIMSGPTVFTQVLQAAASKAKRNHDMIRQNPRYTVLLVITDGIMDNFDETVERLNLYSSMPLSVIFVGVGRSDFARMYQLCQSRSESSRSIVTFVEFRQHQQNASSLGEAALCNIPIQLCQYMQLQGI